MPQGDQLLKIIRDGAQARRDRHSDDDFGAPASSLSRSNKDTWTLVILAGLKPVGRELKTGVLRRMLEAALPLSSEMVISINGEQLQPTKLSAAVAKEWIIGPDLKLDEISLSESDTEGAQDATKTEKAQLIKIVSGSSPYPYIELPDVGRVTGRIRLYEEKISGGKAEERAQLEWLLRECLGSRCKPGRSEFWSRKPQPMRLGLDSG